MTALGATTTAPLAARSSAWSGPRGVAWLVCGLCIACAGHSPPATLPVPTDGPAQADAPDPRPPEPAESALLTDGWADYSGVWDTSFGHLLVTQQGPNVQGVYDYGTLGALLGTVDGRVLTFRYGEANGVRGEGHFELAADGLAFAGSWREDGVAAWSSWEGHRLALPDTAPHDANAAAVSATPARAFDGLYDSTYGRLRLRADGDRVTGAYSVGDGRLEGVVESGRLSFAYADQSGAGVGTFDVAGDQLVGSWTPQGSDTKSAWTAKRVAPEPDVVWLVVLETQWEESLADPEYAWGQMLDDYFGRYAHVRVRQRRIADRADFERAAGELVFLAEPTVLLVSGHGTPDGLTLAGESLGAADLSAVLAPAEQVLLVHFGSCAIMAGGVPAALLEQLPAGRELAVSGYTTTVDWAASAAVDLLFLDLVVGRRWKPRAAADAVLREVGLAGTETQASSPWGALGFALVPATP